MHLHDLVLRARQRPRLVQDLVRHSHLAQIMQICTETDCGLRPVIEPQQARDGKRVLRHPLAVAERIAVGRFDRLPPFAHHFEVRGLELGDLAVHRYQIDARIEPAEQAVRGVEQRERVLIAPHRLHQ